MVRHPSPAAPSSSAGAPSKVMSAWLRVGSMVSTTVRVTPGPLRSTSARETPRSSWPAAVRTETMAKSAMSPSGTASLAPLILPPANWTWIDLGDTPPTPSAWAKVPITSPAASFGSQAAF